MKNVIAREGANFNVADVADNPLEHDQTVCDVFMGLYFIVQANGNSNDRILIYPAEFDAENEQEYKNFQHWCKEDGRDVPPWPPEENTQTKEKSNDKRHEKNEDESDEDDESDNDDDEDWLPEEFNVSSDPLPTEATIRRPLNYLIFRIQDKGFLASSIVRGMSLSMKTTEMTPLQAAVMKNIQENRKTPSIALLLDRTSFQLRVSALQSSVPVYRDIRVPANMNLRMLQTRVLCPVFDWDAKDNPEKYVYYLPHGCYPSQRRPLSTFKDIVFTMPFQDDFFGQMLTHNREATEPQVIDDSDVCLADFLQKVDDTLYYQHNLLTPITLQLKVLQVSQEDSVELMGGVGISPPEDNLITEGPFEREIVGIDAFNLAIKWLQSLKIYEGYKKEGKRLLQIEDSAAFDPTEFNLSDARERLHRSLSHSTARTHIPITTGQSFAMLVSGHPGPKHFPKILSLGMCKTCLKENVKLLKCGRCKSVFYCSKECQKKDWKTHKAVCVRC